MKQLLIGIMIWVTPLVFAQNEPYYPDFFSYYGEEDVRVEQVMTDYGLVRSDPSVNSRLIDTLYEGTLVTIEAVMEEKMVLRKLKAPWMRVSYLKNGVSRKGYIWAGLLSMKRLVRNDEVFAVGVSWGSFTKENEQYYVQVKLQHWKNNQKDQQIEFSKTIVEQSYSEIKFLGGMGLKGVKEIIRMGFMGEACGIASNYIYYAWDGTDFLKLPTKTTVGDANVYSYVENLIFPSEHRGDATLIVKELEEEDMISEEEDQKFEKYSAEYKVKRQREEYYWNGKTAELKKRK